MKCFSCCLWLLFSSQTKVRETSLVCDCFLCLFSALFILHYIAENILFIKDIRALICPWSNESGDNSHIQTVVSDSHRLHPCLSSGLCIHHTFAWIHLHGLLSEGFDWKILISHWKLVSIIKKKSAIHFSFSQN